MREFIHFVIRCLRESRHRDGIAGLAVSSAFLCGWLRSLSHRDCTLMEQHGDESHLLCSHDGSIVWCFCVWSDSSHKVIREEILFTIPYWSVIVPLIVISAYLMLRESRPAKRPLNSLLPSIPEK